MEIPVKQIEWKYYSWLFIEENDPVLHVCEWQEYVKL